MEIVSLCLKYTQAELSSSCQGNTDDMNSRKHGRFRPALLSMIKSNTESLINKCISEALKALPTQTSFPKQSLDALSPLRGVGPATASLILAILTTCDLENQQVPFYSDDTYLWIWFKEYPTSGSGYTGNGKKVEENSKYVKPSGELNVKYNAAEYKQFWEACVEVRERLGEGVSMGDVEKVGFVLRHIGDSEFWENQGKAKGEVAGEEKKSEDVVEEKDVGDVGEGHDEEMERKIEGGDGDGRRRSSRTSKRVKKD